MGYNPLNEQESLGWDLEPKNVYNPGSEDCILGRGLASLYM